MYTKMLERSNQRGMTLIDRESFIAWAGQSAVYAGLFESWQMAGFPMRLVPTVDRINYRQGYVVGNMQFLTHSENVLKGNRETNRKPPPGKNTKAIVIENGCIEERFSSGKAACDFLGLHRNAICLAIKNGKPVNGWTARYA